MKTRKQYEAKAERIISELDRTESRGLRILKLAMELSKENLEGMKHGGAIAKKAITKAIR